MEYPTTALRDSIRAVEEMEFSDPSNWRGIVDRYKEAKSETSSTGVDIEKYDLIVKKKIDAVFEAIRLTGMRRMGISLSDLVDVRLD